MKKLPTQIPEKHLPQINELLKETLKEFNIHDISFERRSLKITYDLHFGSTTADTTFPDWIYKELLTNNPFFYSKDDKIIINVMFDLAKKIIQHPDLSQFSLIILNAPLINNEDNHPRIIDFLNDFQHININNSNHSIFLHYITQTSFINSNLEDLENIASKLESQSDKEIFLLEIIKGRRNTEVKHNIGYKILTEQIQNKSNFLIYFEKQRAIDNTPNDTLIQEAILRTTDLFEIVINTHIISHLSQKSTQNLSDVAHSFSSKFNQIKSNEESNLGITQSTLIPNNTIRLSGDNLNKEGIQQAFRVILKLALEDKSDTSLDLKIQKINPKLIIATMQLDNIQQKTNSINSSTNKNKIKI